MREPIPIHSAIKFLLLGKTKEPLRQTFLRAYVCLMCVFVYFLAFPFDLPEKLKDFLIAVVFYPRKEKSVKWTE